MNRLKIARRPLISRLLLSWMSCGAANEKEAAGEHIVHMEVGQPATKAPQKVRGQPTRRLMKTALAIRMRADCQNCEPAYPQHYRNCLWSGYSPSRIIVTTGSSAGFVLAFLALFDKGARVALPVPGYPCYPHILRALDIEPLF